MRLHSMFGNFKRMVLDYVNIAAFYLSGTYWRNQKVLESLHNMYAGKRCFVVCNGPSLRPEDLTKIHEHGDISIGMNLIGRVYDKTQWRVTVLDVTDGINYVKGNKSIARNTEAEYKQYSPKRYFYSLKCKGKKFFRLLDSSRDLLDYPRFDPDIRKSNNPSIGTSTFECLELAVYLGCSDIYILGCDMSYKVNLNRDGTITYNDAGKDHFYKKEAEAVASCPLKPNPTWEMEVAFDCAAKWSAEHGNIIKNATRGGKLESFPRVDFDHLFN